MFRTSGIVMLELWKRLCRVVEGVVLEDLCCGTVERLRMSFFLFNHTRIQPFQTMAAQFLAGFPVRWLWMSLRCGSAFDVVVV